MADIDELLQLGVALESDNPPQSMQLIVGVDLTAFLMTTEILAHGLGQLGLRAPFVDLLRLEIHRGHIRSDALQATFTHALPKFPNLKTLVVMSLSPDASAYIRKFPPAQAPPSPLPTSSTPTNEFSTLSPRHLSPQLEYDEERNWPNPVPDALHDESCHIKILAAWHQANPRLERVVFPVGAYTHVNKRKQRRE
ncbi:unnamed protein product [Rhizoctonia solani]|nr:unnamed protein product [Rhizoctonia solani]